MTDHLAAQLTAGASALGVPLTQPQVAALIEYGELILKWNKVYNLTAVRTPEAVVTHHLLDSLAAVPPLLGHLQGRVGARASDATLLDVGAGAGLPGVVLAIAIPSLQVTCVDAVAKKMAFVQQVSAELKQSNLTPIHSRVEHLSGAFDVVTSRAFASLNDFYEGSRNALAPDGVWMALKGKRPNDEIAAIPADRIDVFHVEPLIVPGLDADRCMVWARPRSGPRRLA